MVVRLFPHATRPGIGLRPRQESRRPLLPQHSRHCPVLEAASGLGFLVYPPLEANETFTIEFEGDGRYRFTFAMGSAATQWQPLFSILLALPVGGIGRVKEDVELARSDVPLTADAARNLMRMFIVPEDLGTPAGAVTLRGSANFQTPEGWDTVYTAVVNSVERPVVPTLVVRVETDWYAHESEFRYLLQPGEAISGARQMPIGQVFFVSREAVDLRDATEEELAAIKTSKQTFATAKAEATQSMPYGLQFSPHYLRESQARRQTSSS